MMDAPQSDGLVPRSTQEILTQTFRTYTDNLAAYLSASATVIIPLAIIGFVIGEIFIDDAVVATINEQTGEVTDFEVNAEAFGAVFGAAFLLGIVTLIIQQIFLNGVFTFIASEDLLGRQITPVQAFASIKDRFATLGLGLVMVYAILISITFALAFVFFLCGLGIGVIIFLGVTLFSFLVPTIILENVSAGQGLRRSFALAKARFWPVFWVTAAVIIINSLLQILFSFNIFGLGDSALAQTIIGATYNLIVAPIMPIALTLTYYDTRIRMEGLDMGLAAVDSPTPRPADVPSTDLEVAFTRQDVSIIVVLSVGAIVLVLGLSVLFGTFSSTVVTTTP